MIHPNCRARFTGEDFAFIVRVLARHRQQEVNLVSLLTDEAARDQILDHEALVHAVLENPTNLTISPQFYFYILARLALKRSGLMDRSLADYVASLLEHFTRMRRLQAPVGNVQSTYLSDLLLALQNATPYQTFLIRAHIGNYALFITGIFYENVERRSLRGAPSCSFYETLGQRSFHTIASHDVARRFEMTDLFENLSEQFHKCRLALNRLAEELLDFNDNRHLPSLQ
ncbi:MAG: hypothetical protein JO022_11510 [Acidobacteriaceae bacterium]|nr:hypothetical protein [Acidobacteriaceae bacterium]